MRIACLANEQFNANGFYRGAAPMKHLADRGNKVTQLHGLKPKAAIEAIHHADVLYIHRYTDKDTLRMVRDTKATGTAIVWDNDDDLEAVSPNDPQYNHDSDHSWLAHRTRTK